MDQAASDRAGRRATQAAAGEGPGCAGEVERHHGQDEPGAVRVELPGGQVRQGAVLQVAWTCSMIACPRWVLSAATVSSLSGSVLVKNASNRQSSNNDA